MRQEEFRADDQILLLSHDHYQHYTIERKVTLVP